MENITFQKFKHTFFVLVCNSTCESYISNTNNSSQSCNWTVTFIYLSQLNWRILIAIKINSDQKERIYKHMKQKAFKQFSVIVLLCAKFLLLKFLYLKNYFNFTFSIYKKINSYEKYLSTNNCTNTQQKLFLKVVRNVAWSTACTR